MPVSATESGVIAFVFCLVFILGSFSNGLVVLTYIRWRRELLTQSRDVLILSLAVGDFVLSFLVCPLGFSSAIVRKWLWGHVGCILDAFFTTWVGLATISQLAFHAVERYITLKSPLTLSNIVSSRQCFHGIMASWLLTFVVSCFPLVGWSNYTLEGLKLHCAIPWDKRSIDNTTFCIFLLILFYLAPVGVIAVSYVKIIFLVRRMYKNAERIWGLEAQATKEAYTAQVKAAKQLLIMIVGFLFAWTPYAIMSMMILFFDVKIPLGHREYPSMFAKTAVLYNPIIYFFTHRRLREKAMETLKCVYNVVNPV